MEEQLKLAEEAKDARRYRAVLVGIPRKETKTGIQAQQQCFSSSYAFLKKWGKDVLVAYPLEEFPQAAVVIYETKEVLVGTIVPEPPEKPKDKEAKSGTCSIQG
jgi:hypothetical protein